MTSRAFRNTRGMTLVEVMIASVILSIAILALLGTFGGMSKSMQYSRVRTFATQMANGKIQALKNVPYYRLTVTTAPVTLAGVSPQVEYDPFNFKPEVQPQASINYTRYTLVQMAQENSFTGEVEVSTETSARDVGMKLVTVSVVWREDGEDKVFQVRNVFANPRTPMRRSTLTGVVQSTTGANITFARVYVEENSSWGGNTNGSGAYNFPLGEGTYTVAASAPGYHTRRIPNVVVGPNATVTPAPNPIPLNRIAFGTLTGTVWLNPRLLLSRVVGSTIAVSGFDQEYVEIFNPTTFTWTVQGDLRLFYAGRPGGADPKTEIAYTNLSAGNQIVSGGYYLFANTSPVRVGGLDLDADAVWDHSINDLNNDLRCYDGAGGDPNAIPVYEDQAGPCLAGGGGIYHGVGALELFSASRGVQDQYGWKGGVALLPAETPELYEGWAYDQNFTNGMNQNEEFRRMSSTAGVSNAYGAAYDSPVWNSDSGTYGNNDVDWVRASPVFQAPFNSSLVLPVVAGVPAVGAFVSVTDGLSASTQAVLTTVPFFTPYPPTPPSWAQYTAPNVATGSWNVFISSISVQRSTTLVSGLLLEPGGMTLQMPPAILDQEERYNAYVQGRVTDSGGVPLPVVPGVSIKSGSLTQSVPSSGYYMLRIPLPPENVDAGLTSAITVVANPDSQNPGYESDSATRDLSEGMYPFAVDFSLSPAGKVRGAVASAGGTGLSGIGVVVQDVGSQPLGEGLTDPTGQFVIDDIPVGNFTVSPVLEALEFAQPASFSGILTGGGGDVFVGTFTITGSMGLVTGKVTDSGQPITAGVLLVASTYTLTASPTVSSGTANAASSFYMTTSRPDGSYSLEVVGSTFTPYYVTGYYSKFVNNVPQVSTMSISLGYVGQGVTVNNQNLSW